MKITTLVIFGGSILMLYCYSLYREGRNTEIANAKDLVAHAVFDHTHDTITIRYAKNAYSLKNDEDFAVNDCNMVSRGSHILIRKDSAWCVEYPGRVYPDSKVATVYSVYRGERKYN